MKRLSLPSLTGCLAVCLSLAAETALNDYEKLKTHYENVLQQVDSAKQKELEAVRMRQVAKANKLSAEYREDGNIGFHLKAKNYAEFLKNDQMNRMNWDQVQDDRLKNLHRETENQFANVQEAFRNRQFHMMDRMKTLIETRINQTENNPELSAVMKKDLEEITSNPVFQSTGDRISKQQEVRSARLAQQAAQKPLATATPIPVNTEPRLDIDVFRKRTGKFPPDFHPTTVKVQVRSKEMQRVYEKVVIEVWFVDRMVDSSKEFRIESTHRINVGELAPGQVAEKESPEIRSNPPKRSTAAWEFYGYVVAVKDKDGKLLTFKSFPNRLDEIERAEKVMKNREGDTFTLF